MRKDHTVFLSQTRSLSSSTMSFSHLLFNPPYKYSVLFPLQSRADKFQFQTSAVFRKNVPVSQSYLLLWTPMEDPRASNCSEIWKASSLVGVRTRANNRWGVSSSAWRIGKAKAPVFPEPVSASPMISLPTRSSNEEKNCYKSRPEKEAFKALCSKAQEFPKDRKKRRHAKGKEEQRAKPKNFRTSLQHF